jgi:hypothetical protein
MHVAAGRDVAAAAAAAAAVGVLDGSHGMKKVSHPQYLRQQGHGAGAEARGKAERLVQLGACLRPTL